MPDNDRLEREIEEILGKIEQFPGPESRAQRARKRSVGRASARVSGWRQSIAHRISNVDMSQLMLLSFVMILAAFFLRGRMLPPLVATWILYGGVILFVSTFAVMVFGRGRRGGTPTVQQTWRGRTIQYRQGPSVTDRLRRLLGGRTRR